MALRGLWEKTRWHSRNSRCLSCTWLKPGGEKERCSSSPVGFHMWSRAVLVLQQTSLVPCVWWWDPGLRHLPCGLSGSWPAAPRQTAREGTPEPLKVLRWALPCVRVAPNSQGWGPQHPECHPCGPAPGCWPSGPAGTNSQGWGPQDPKRPKGPPFPGTLLPYLAHWASLPLFCFRPPSPCPWAAAMPYGAEARLLRCCWCLLVNVDTLAYTVPRATGAWPSLAITSPGACHVPCLLVCSHDRPAEPLLLAAAPG